MFVAVRKSGGSLASSLISRENAPSLAAPVAPTLHVVGAATGPESFRLQPRVSPSDTAVVSPIILPLPSSDAASAGGPNNSDVGAGSTGVDEAVAGGTEMSNGGPASESDTSGSCDACNAVFTIATPTFCCRICRKLFHSECAGYNTSTKRQSPPPDWICPRCPNGERGPSETIHRSLKGKGVVKQQRGNQPFCPICLGDDRVPGKGRIGRCSMTKCRGCGLHTHADCLKKLDIGPDGRWPCDECQRRRDGVVPGNNPAWLRLKEARLDGGWEVSAVPDAASAAAAAAAVEETGAAAAASLDPNPTEDLGHLQPSSKSAERRTRTRVGSTRRRSAPGGRASGDGTTSCCKKSVTPKRPVFCCRVCRKLFHGPCAGYDPKGRQVPPPDWICPNCPNGERGPGENLVDPSLKGKGVVNQKHGNMPWCPICLSDNRVSGKKRLGDIERCPGCSFHTHAHCLAGLQIYHDGRWPCDECDRRRHGVVPGDNPVWKRLKAARLDGGRKPTWTHSWTQVPSSLGAAGATPPAIAPSDSPNSDVAGSLKGSAPSSTTVKVGAETATGVCEPAEGTPPVFHDQDPVQNQHRHTTVPGSQELAATGGVGCVLPAAAAGAATETAADTAAGACEPPEGTPPVFDDQDHVQNHSTVPGSHEMAVTGGVVSLLPAAAAGAATEREALRSPPAGSPFSDHMHFSQRRRPSGVVEMAIRAAVEAVAVVAAASAGAPASCDPPLGPAPSSAEVLAARGAAARPPEAAETGCQSVGSWFMGCSTLPSEDSSEAPAVLAVAPAAGPATPAGVGGDPVAEGGEPAVLAVAPAAGPATPAGMGGDPVAEGRKTDPEQTISSPPRAKESSRGITGDESNNAHTPADAPPNGNSSSEGRSSCCEACGKVFIPSLRPSFCCRACRNLFHGDCAGYARHKRQCPPPDWICPHCPNGERGPTEYDTHTSLKGKGAVHQKLGNQLWCPICFGDDRALGSAQNGPGGKKCPGCGLRTHGHCMSGLEIGPDGRWPCDECQRRRDGINPGDNSLWLRLKTARLDGGPAVAITSVPLPTSGATTTTAAAASTWSPQISGAGPSSCSATRSADAGPAKAAGAVCPLAANASLLSVAPLYGGVQTPSTSPLPSEVTASAPSTSKAPATPMDSSQAFSSCGAPTSSTASAASATPPTRPLSPPSFSCQPAQPVALPVSPPASRTSVPTDLPGSPSSPASSLGGAMQGSAPASSNAAAPSRVDTTEPSDMVEDVSVPRTYVEVPMSLEDPASFVQCFVWSVGDFVNFCRVVLLDVYVNAAPMLFPCCNCGDRMTS